MIHRRNLLLLVLGVLACAQLPPVEPRHPPTSLLTESKVELPGPDTADARGFRPECTALIPYKLQPPIVPPKAVDMVAPKFGPRALRMRLTGQVVLEAVIDESGRVCDARVLKGLRPLPPQMFEEPVREALLKSRFRPATFGEVPIAVVYLHTVRFEI
jgi:TonB family protein